MPFYLRKRPGNKNVKANITQGGLRSLTFTTGSKKGRPRVNLNTTRGWSFSIPGTGFVWRQKGYGSSEYKSVVEERGYDLRTKEGRVKAEEESNKNTFIFLVIGIGLAVGWLSGERLYGFLASYLTFFLFLPFGANSGPGTYVWALLAHVFGGLGYGVSLVFVTDWVEPTAIGVVVGTLVSSILLNGLGLTLFVISFLSVLWALVGEPSLYIEDIAGRIWQQVNNTFGNIVAIDSGLEQTVGDKNIEPKDSALPKQLNFVLNVFGALFLITNIIGTCIMTFLNVKRSSFSTFSKLAIAPVSIAALILAFTISIVLGRLALNLLPAEQNDLEPLYKQPLLLASSVIFSISVGYFLCRIYSRQNKLEKSFLNSFIACLLCLFWLPIFAQQEKPTVVKSKKSDNEAFNTEAAKVKIDRNYEAKLKSVIGLGEKRRNKILQHFPNPKILLAQDKQTILFKTGVGKTVLARIHKTL